MCRSRICRDGFRVIRDVENFRVSLLGLSPVRRGIWGAICGDRVFDSGGRLDPAIVVGEATVGSDCVDHGLGGELCLGRFRGRGRACSGGFRGVVRRGRGRGRGGRWSGSPRISYSLARYQTSCQWMNSSSISSRLGWRQTRICAGGGLVREAWLHSPFVWCVVLQVLLQGVIRESSVGPE